MDDPGQDTSSADTEKAGRGPGNSFKAFRVAGPLFGSGIQLAAAVAVFFFAGRWLDEKLGTSPWLMLLGALLGAGGGMYKFIRTAIDVGKDEAAKDGTHED